MKTKLVLISALMAFVLNVFAAEPDSDEILNTPPTKEQADSVKAPASSKKAHTKKKKTKKSGHSKKRNHKKKPTH